ncbi:phosphotransferase family protein [Variovorax sp. PBL-E5]|uniref:phosphotransferase family protein n=1 Tax=Variovorax sp. PBL-E5 TaxID=434014 RepID=UPI001315F896|nr:phosphotransferase family protein [Variovorax sp. PBL-E5]VTU30728.1 Aminoglycoside phosphotransferase [Variovorax sp. PBL-E5]
MITTNQDAATAASLDIRDDPSEAFIADMRQRFPTEPETDALLTRKMRRRSGPPYQQVSLAQMTKWLHAMLSDRIQGSFTVRDPKWLTGGASKVQVSFMLDWEAPGRGACSDHLVIRMDPSEASNTTSRVREAELLDAFQDRLAVPKVFWIDREAQWFPEPAIIYTFVSGVAKPRSTSAGQVVGLGTNFGPRLRELLAPQFLRDLAIIHTADLGSMHFESMEQPSVGSEEAARWQLNRARRVWEEDRGEDYPLMDVAANWLERNLPVLDRTSVVHGDFRSGNFLFDGASGNITAWLDWERGHLGDRHRDLAWMTQREKGHLAEDGKTYLVCGLIPLEAFYERYEKASGLSVDPRRLRWYRVLNCFQVITTTMATMYRVAKLGKSHQDILLARLKAIAPIGAHELCELLEGNL